MVINIGLDVDLGKLLTCYFKLGDTISRTTEVGITFSAEITLIGYAICNEVIYTFHDGIVTSAENGDLVALSYDLEIAEKECIIGKSLCITYENLLVNGTVKVRSELRGCARELLDLVTKQSCSGFYTGCCLVCTDDLIVCKRKRSVGVKRDYVIGHGWLCFVSFAIILLLGHAAAKGKHKCKNEQKNCHQSEKILSHIFPLSRWI